jgi:ABC-type Mn2+/Zn2+ transport system permease subunit
MDDINVYKKTKKDVFISFVFTVFFSVEILLVNLIRPLSGASVNESNIK